MKNPGQVFVGFGTKRNRREKGRFRNFPLPVGAGAKPGINLPAGNSTKDFKGWNKLTRLITFDPDIAITCCINICRKSHYSVTQDRQR